MNVAFSNVSGISLALSAVSGISVDFSNINYREEMKYLATINIASGVETSHVTTITTEPYSIEFIDSSGNVITTGMGEPVLAASGSYYMITVYNGGATLTGVKLKILY
jgi:hypothetical protein